MGNYTLTKEEKEVIYRKIGALRANLSDPKASIELKNVSAREIQHLEDVLEGKALGQPLFVRDPMTGELKLSGE